MINTASGSKKKLAAFAICVLVLLMFALIMTGVFPFPARCINVVEPAFYRVDSIGDDLGSSGWTMKPNPAAGKETTCKIAYFYELEFWLEPGAKFIWDYIPHQNGQSPYRTMDPIYSADFSNDQILVGASHHIFVGRVLRQIGSTDLGIGTETQFEVE